jgi:hypothetical protein
MLERHGLGDAYQWLGPAEHRARSPSPSRPTVATIANTVSPSSAAAMRALDTAAQPPRRAVDDRSRGRRRRRSDRGDARRATPRRDRPTATHRHRTVRPPATSVVRLQLDRPLYYHPGQYVTVRRSGHAGRLSPSIPPTAEAQSISRPLGHRWHVSPAIVETDQTPTGGASNPHGHATTGRRRRADDRRQHWLAPLRTLIMDRPMGSESAVRVSSAAAIPATCTTFRRCGSSQRPIRGCP